MKNDSRALGRSDPATLLARARALHQAGQIAQAEPIYRDLLAAYPDHVDANFLLGLAHAQRGNLPLAAEYFGKAACLKPDFVDGQFNYALALQSTGRQTDALAFYDKTIALKRDHAIAHYNRAVILHQLGRSQEALAGYDDALKTRAGYAEAHFSKGVLLHELERYSEAVLSFDQTLRLMPARSDAHFSRAASLNKLRRFKDAALACDQALKLNPASLEALCNKSLALLGLGAHEAALAASDQAVKLNASLPAAHAHRAAALKGLFRQDDAIKAYDRALALYPATETLAIAQAWQGRGEAQFEQNDHIGAKQSFERALAAKPDHAPARFAACIASLPSFYLSDDEVAHQRDLYARELARLSADVEQGRMTGDLVAALAAKQPFFLAYQGENDVALQRTYGELACNIMARAYPTAPMPQRPAPGEKIRVGIVSSFFRLHSNWKMPIRGWLEHLDRSRFRLFGYHTGSQRDAETEIAAALCERFVHGAGGVADWRRKILTDAPHVLIYPGLLMEGETLQLAAQRLAPVQCNSWGHPETSGMPTIDHFLSSDLMEPPGAHAHYSEKLVRLPNLSIWIEPVGASAPLRREKLGLRASACVFWCGQSLFKYLPRDDHVFARIAKRAPHAQFAFLRHIAGEAVTAQFRVRLANAFAAEGLSVDDHCVFIDRLTPSDYVAAMGAADVFLDSIGWSGCNSALESLAHDLPIVTTPGPLMRGRHCAAILRMMGVEETIAPDVESYIALAADLANDAPHRKSISEKMGRQKHRLYRDRTTIAALEAFLECAATGD